MNEDFKKSLILLKDGYKLFFKTTAYLFDKYAHKYPYLYMSIMVACFVGFYLSVMIPQRLEANEVSHTTYIMQQSIDSLNTIVSSYKYKELQRHIDDSVKKEQQLLEEKEKRQQWLMKRQRQQSIKKDSI